MKATAERFSLTHPEDERKEEKKLPVTTGEERKERGGGGGSLQNCIEREEVEEKLKRILHNLVHQCIRKSDRGEYG